MKKFLFTLAALFMAGSALADSGFYFGEFDESTLGTTNESTLTLTQDDLAGEYEMYGNVGVPAMIELDIKDPKQHKQVLNVHIHVNI